jgi:hypothetical protein
MMAAKRQSRGFIGRDALNAGILSAGVLLMLATLAACGDDHGRRCAAGTKPDPTGRACVPDGSVICGNGTTYDADTGTCVSSNGCPSGQLLVNGTCAVNVKSDAEEAIEPNDSTSAGTIPLPVIGAPGYTVHGCITPHQGAAVHATSDNDPWSISVSGPTLLDVTAVGTGGLAAGFEVKPKSEDLATLIGHGWRRFGVNLVDSTSRRQVFLPRAGTYDIAFADSRQLSVENAPAGSDRTCYFATVSQLAIPAPTALSLTENAITAQVGTIGGEVQFFSIPAPDGGLIFANLSFDAGTSATPSIVQQLAGSYARSYDALIGGAAQLNFAGTRPSDQIVFVVDSQSNYALAPVTFTLTVIYHPVPALPTGGQTSTFAPVFHSIDDGYLSLSYFWFDVDAGDLIQLRLGFAQDANFLIMNPSLELDGYTGTVKHVLSDGISELGLGDGPQAMQFQGWYRFPVAGRYYVAVYDPDLAPDATIEMTSTLTRATAAPIALGTAIEDHPLNQSNTEWFTLDPTAEMAIAAFGSGSNLSGDLQVDYYHDGLQAGGLFDVDFSRTFEHTFVPVGGETRGRLTFGDPAKYVVRISQSGTDPVAGDAIFSLQIARQAFVDLGTVTATTPADRATEVLGNAERTKRYFVQGNEGDDVAINIHSDVALTVKWLDVDEGARASSGGVDVTLRASFGRKKYVAFEVSNEGALANFELHVSAKSPPGYTMTTGAVAFTDICDPDGANWIPFNNGNGDLSDPQSIPFAFNLFDDPVMTYTVSMNGWLSFASVVDSARINQPIPTEGAPEAIVAPFWSELGSIVCKTEDANRVILQWSGISLNTAAGLGVETQVVIHKGGSIDFIWGSAQQDNGFLASIGLENLFGTFGQQFEYHNGVIQPNSSVTFTPKP